MDSAKDDQPKPTEITKNKSPSKRQLAADDAEMDAGAPRPKRVRFDSVALETEITEKPPINQESYDEWILSATSRTPPAPGKSHARNGPTDKTRPAPSCPRSSSSQLETLDGYFPFLAWLPPKEKEWKQKEDRYLLDAAKRRDDFSVISQTLLRSEEACRKRVAHLARVLYGQLAGFHMALDEELLDKIKQKLAKRSRVVPDEEASRGDDDIMKLVIWKFYQRQDVLNPAVMEGHEGLREELEELEWMDLQLLKRAASFFLKRRVKTGAQ